MNNASSLADKIGRKRIADTIGVGVTAVSNAVVRGCFPSSWFVAMARLARDYDADCPPDLFGMKALESPEQNPTEGAK